MAEVDDGGVTANDASNPTTSAGGDTTSENGHIPAAEESGGGYQKVNVVGVLGPRPPSSQSNPNPAQQGGIRPRPPVPLPKPRPYELPGPRTTEPEYTYLDPQPSQRRDAGRQAPPDEVTPLVPPRGEPVQPELYDLQNAVCACLGIGRRYSGVCNFLSFLFFAGGIIIIGVVVASLARVPEGTTNARIVGNLLSGVIFILMSSFRLLAKLCNRVGDRRRKKWLFGGLIMYAWFVSLGYAATVGILASTADYCFYCPSTDSSSYFVNRMTFWVLVGMLLVPGALSSTVIIFFAWLN